MKYPKKNSTCPNQFKRPADLERHYRHVHKVKPVASREGSASPSATPLSPFDDTGNYRAKAKEEEIYICDRGGCSRNASNPLERKDHFRDHLREFHKEDVGREKWKKDETDEVRREKQMAWEDGRVINPGRWRCIKCLTNNKVSRDGWVCGGVGCKGVCEDKRREVREKMVEVKRSDMGLLMGVGGVCNTCAGNGMYYDQDCPDCMRGDGQGMVYDEPFFATAMHSYDGDEFMS